MDGTVYKGSCLLSKNIDIRAAIVVYTEREGTALKWFYLILNGMPLFSPPAKEPQPSSKRASTKVLPPPRKVWF